MLELICKLDIGYKDNEKYVIASSTDEEVLISPFVPTAQYPINPRQSRKAAVWGRKGGDHSACRRYATTSKVSIRVGTVP